MNDKKWCVISNVYFMLKAVLTVLDIFQLSFFPPSADVLEGYNGTIFAYGQTSSGKTHTMEVRYSISSFANALMQCIN